MRVLRFALLGLVAAFTLKAAPASAEVLFEPYLGYKMGTFDNNGTKGDLTGAAVGARLGIAFPVVFIAADYSILSGGEINWDSNALGKSDITNDQLYVDVGVSLPLIRGYAGYGLINDLKFKNGAKLTKGTLWKLGVGTTILPFVAINLEYQNAEHDKADGVEVDGVKSNAFMLSLSVPFEF